MLRRLLSKYGYLSIEMQTAMSVDEVETAEELRDAKFAESKEVITVDARTGEVVGTGTDNKTSEASLSPSKPLDEKAGDADDVNPFD